MLGKAVTVASLGEYRCVADVGLAYVPRRGEAAAAFFAHTQPAQPPGCSGTRHYLPADYIPWTPGTQIQTTAFLSKVFLSTLEHDRYDKRSPDVIIKLGTFFIRLILLM